MFAAQKRPLVFPLGNAVTLSSEISADEPDCDGSSAVIFPSDPDERTVIPFLLSLNEYNVLASAIDVGSDIAYGEDAIAVMWLWLRNTRCMDMICDWLSNCTQDAIGAATGVDQYQRYQAIAVAKQAKYEADWDGTPQSINPDAPETDYDDAGTDDDKLALCSACEAFVKLYAAQKVQQLTIVYVGFSVIISFLALLIPGLGWILGTGIAVAIGGAVLVGGVTYAAAIDALNDVLALNDVTCCMKDALMGQAINTTNFNASLSGCSFDVGSNAEIARGFVEAALTDNFYTFIDILGEARQAIAAGVPVDCACNHWESVLDFTVSDYGFITGVTGEYTTGVGFEDTYGAVGGGYRGVNLALDFASPANITYAEMTFEYAAGLLEASGDTTAGVYSEAPEFLIDVLSPAEPVSPETGEGDLAFNTINVQLLCGIRLGVTPDDPGGSCILTQLVLRGTGTKPTELP